VNADCIDPSKPHCNTTTHTCEATPDAGADGGVDGGPRDAGKRDAHAGGDAITEPDAAEMGGFVEGGGLSCALGSPAREPPIALAGLLAGLGIALRARRRRR
jgi:MYXO-CTERM domain-containing protein